MHQQVLDFISQVKAGWPEYFNGQQTVLECGSYDVNGTPRHLFESASEYVGVDHREGPGVDEVSLIHEYQGRPDGYFDVIISTEVFEHDPYWRRSLKRMLELLKPGGSMILTMASDKRPVHELECAPIDGYYGPLSAGDVLYCVASFAGFNDVRADNHERNELDHYFFFGGKR